MDAALIMEQNKIASSGAWIWLLEITYGTSSVFRFANNNSVVQWPSTGSDLANYQPISFSMDDVSFSTSGKFPSYKLQIGDVFTGSDLRTQVQAGSGLVGQTVRLMVVHSAHLDITTPAIDELAEILSCEVTAQAITFTIGIPSLLSRRFPKDRYVPGFCRHRFAGALCKYVQPSYSISSSQISFAPGVSGAAGVQYNTITCGIGNLIQKVFKHALPAGTSNGLSGTAWRWALAKDTGFTVSGSKYNDGFFLANNHHAVAQLYVRVIMEADGGRAFVAESSGNSITIQLGYDGCGHTLDACALRDNTQNYGGSPGVIGGMYG